MSEKIKRLLYYMLDKMIAMFDKMTAMLDKMIANIVTRLNGLPMNKCVYDDNNLRHFLDYDVTILGVRQKYLLSITIFVVYLVPSGTKCW
jgi:hypothetical protein